ncbi:MAG: tetratricopeptide repeat protein [Deltaproteobacteria bacterium]|nr:tetratricopeptide repeat protein [Deltaproteobacteria bacterium]
MLAQMSSSNQEVATDFLALPGDWQARASYWTEFLGGAESKKRYMVEYAKAHNRGIPSSRLEPLSELTLGALWHMDGFDRSPPDHKAANRTMQADRALSIGRFDIAAEHLTRAVAHQPKNAVYHFKLGATLGELAADGHRQYFEEAIMECRIAVALDPQFGNARNEIGVILSNARRHEEAEAAFAEAESHHGRHAHHWYTRGFNLLAMHRFEAARTAFVKAISLSVDQVHIPAMRLLAATLMQLGEQGEALRLGKKVQRATGEDPTKNYEAVLDVFCDGVPDGTAQNS